MKSPQFLPYSENNNIQNISPRTEGQCSALEPRFGTLEASSAPCLAPTLDSFMA